MPCFCFFYFLLSLKADKVLQISSHFPCTLTLLVFLQVQDLGGDGPLLTDNSPGFLWLEGVINFSKRPPRLSAFINERLRAMDNLTTPLSPP